MIMIYLFLLAVAIVSVATASAWTGRHDRRLADEAWLYGPQDHWHDDSNQT